MRGVAVVLALVVVVVVVVGCSASAGDEPQVACKTTICASRDDASPDDASPDDASPADGGAVDPKSDSSPGTTSDAVPSDAMTSDAASGADAKADARADSTSADSSAGDSSAGDSSVGDASGADTSKVDTSVTDTATTSGPITGGPCASGTAGATAFRIRYTSSGSYAQANYDVNGLPSGASLKVSFSGPGSIPGPSPQWGDPFLGPGGLDLAGENFIDVQFSTSGIGSITKATLLVYGRSYSTGSSGSFRWQTFDGAGASVSGSISNSTPYRWYGTEVTSGVPVNKSIYLRMKAGPPSGSLVVNQFELCVEAS